MQLVAIHEEKSVGGGTLRMQLVAIYVEKFVGGGILGRLRPFYYKIKKS